MIIDRHTFIDLATHLEGASEGVLDITRRCVALCEDASEGAVGISSRPASTTAAAITASCRAAGGIAVRATSRRLAPSQSAASPAPRRIVQAGSTSIRKRGS